MLGLEYVLNLYDVQHIELAEKLGIKKQNINLWIKEKQNIPKKYLPLLSNEFNIPIEYLQKHLSELEKLEIQQAKIQKELQPVIKGYDRQFDGIDGMVNEPVYDYYEMNSVGLAIEKARIIEDIKKSLDDVDIRSFIDTYKVIAMLLNHSGDEVILKKTIEALGHYFGLISSDIYSSEEQPEFEEQIFEVFDDNNFWLRR